jgi:hypothetical protein
MLVAVFDRAGRPTVDVGPDEFLIEEGNDEREVLSVQVADYPVTVLLDNARVGADALAAMRAATTRFIQRIGQRPVAIATLADPPAFVASFDDDRSQVLAALDTIAAAAPAPGRPLAALTQAAQRISALQSPFAVVVVLSGGTVEAAEQPDADRLAPIIESGAAVHVIALRPGGPGANDTAPDLYRAVAEQTHGQFVPIFSALSFGVALDRLADGLSMEMMVDYLVPAGSSGQDARVGIRIPGARVRGLGVSK